MMRAWVFSETALLVRHWFEIDLADSHLEHGARLELRTLTPLPYRGTESASQRLDIDVPLWRADVFDLIEAAPGNFLAAHYHPHFDGLEPSERHWDPHLTRHPWVWLTAQLRALPDVLAARAPGVDAALAAVELRPVVGDIVAAARTVAGAECPEAATCFTSTRDASAHVAQMLAHLQQPSLLDETYVAPWRALLAESSRT